MPIRGFEQLFVDKASSLLPLSSLEKSILAIDGVWYMKKMVASLTEDQFLGIPETFETFLENLFELNKKVSILWIWDGIEIKKSHINQERLITDTSDDIIGNGHYKWQRFYDQEHYIAHVSKILTDKGIAVLRAPYYAAAQCAYLLGQKKISNAFGRSDMLFFKDCDKVIIDIDFKLGCVRSIDRNKLFEHFKLDLEAFRRLGFLSGCEYCPTADSQCSNFSVAKVYELLSQNTEINPGIKNYGISHDEKYYSEYLTAFSIVDHIPVMHLDGTVSPISNAPCSLNLEESFGRKLSDFIYHRLCTCSLGTRTLETILFSREIPFADQGLIRIFKSIWHKNTEVNKNAIMSEFICKKLDLSIVWNSKFNRASQILFHVLLNGEMDPKCRLRLMNSGYNGERRAVIQPRPNTIDLLYLTANYSPENLKGFYIAQVNLILLKEIVELIRAYHTVTDDLKFDFKLSEFLLPLETEPLKEFVTQSVKEDAVLDEMKQILSDNQ